MHPRVLLLTAQSPRRDPDVLVPSPERLRAHECPSEDAITDNLANARREHIHNSCAHPISDTHQVPY